MPIFAASFESYVAPARQRAELWRLGLGLALIFAAYIGFSTFLVAAATRLGLAMEMMDLSAMAVILLLFTFLGMALGVFAVVRHLHRRPFSGIFGRFAWVVRDFCLAAASVAVVYAISTALWRIWFVPLPGLSSETWLLLLPVAALGILVQTGAEELVFRGYLQQQLAARFSHPAVWAVLPSLAFGLAHFDPATAGANTGLIVGVTALFGVLAADLTAKTGSLGAAWGFHFTNNVSAILLLGMDGPLSGLALYRAPYGTEDILFRYLLLMDVATLLIAWVILRRLLSR